MRGMIVLWYGEIAEIPAGWHLCDGEMGTADLRNKFIVGAGDTYEPLETGGQDEQTHEFTGAGHSHQYVMGTDIPVGTEERLDIDERQVTGTTDPADNRPQFKALCYIQKL